MASSVLGLADTLLGKSALTESPASGLSFPTYKMQQWQEEGPLGFQIKVIALLIVLQHVLFDLG